MTLRYKENGIYIAECNICRCVLGAEKNNQTEMELFLKNNGWKIWKSNNVHQPNCICYNCKSVVDSLVNKYGKWMKGILETDESNCTLHARIYGRNTKVWVWQALYA